MGLTLLCLMPFSEGYAQTFTNVAHAGGAGADLAVGGFKDGGFAWGDINQDGCLDLVVNTDNNTSYSRILIADCSNPTNPTYTDQTSSYCQALLSNVLERCALLVDVNGDGVLDLTRNTAPKIEVYLNQGPSEGYAFGIGPTHTPNFVLETPDINNSAAGDIPGGMNTEGLQYFDYDGDGDLDLLIENHNWGIDLYANDGNANFTYVDPTSVGLPTAATTGDYSSSADFDNDGWVDLVMRKEGQTDFYRNTGGAFAAGVELGDAQNNDKGGVLFADFDNDTDLDLYWSENGTDQIWLQSGVGSGTFIPTKPSGASNDWGEPWLSAGVSAPNLTDGCAVGDVNNDGKIDLIIGGNSGPGFLFINQTPTGGTLSFTHDNKGINFNTNIEGMAFADYDHDGDLDLYVNVNNGPNQLWRNALVGGASDYLFVDALIDLGGVRTRAALGANITLRNCNNDVISGIRDVPSGTGHGTHPDTKVHFGLPAGSGQTYMVQVEFPIKNGLRRVVRKTFVPNSIASQTIIIKDTDKSDTGVCGTFPIELLDFAVEQQGREAYLSWRTARESNSAHFVVERSVDGSLFEVISSPIPAAGFSESISTYQFRDGQLLSTAGETLYYRLKEVDLDGAFVYSELATLTLRDVPALWASVYPNPTTGAVQMRIRTLAAQFVSWQLMDLSGKIMQAGEIPNLTHLHEQSLNLAPLPAGVYTLQVAGESGRASLRLLVMP